MRSGLESPELGFGSTVRTYYYRVASMRSGLESPELEPLPSKVQQEFARFNEVRARKPGIRRQGDFVTNKQSGLQ